MRYINAIIMSAACCAVPIHLSGQDFNSAMAYESFKPYGDVTPSVESFAMTKYGIVSPSLYTGAMSYSIPLYTYSDPDFTLPISLEYNYDGYKPSMASGSVGLGWVLNCGGVITREVRGIPDEGMIDNPNIRGWYHTIMEEIEVVDGENVKSVTFSGANISGSSAATWQPSCDELRGILQSLDPCSDTPVCIPEGTSTKYDLAPDIFHFNFCGMNGDFMIVGKTAGGKIKTRVYNSNLPFGEFEIEMAPINYLGDIPEFVITDGKGMKYYFGGRLDYVETSSSTAIRPKSIAISGGQETSTNLTAFRLYKMEAPARYSSDVRVLEFNYSSSKQYHKSVTTGCFKILQCFWIYTVDWTTTISGCGPCIEDYAYVHGTCNPLLESISIDGHEVVSFSYEERQEDENDQYWFEQAGIGNVRPMHSLERAIPHLFRLSGITVLNLNAEEVESFELDQEFAARGTPKMFLKSVSGLKMGRYDFSYNLEGYNLPPNDTKQFDHWGYWNGKYVGAIKTHVALTGNNYPVFDIYGQMTDSVKESDWEKAACGALCRIFYPSGGESLIEYEANTVGRRVTAYSLPQPCDPYDIGGIRVKRITNRADGDVSDSIEYRYACADGTPSGVLLQMPRYAVRGDFDYTSVKSIGSFTGTLNYISYLGGCNCLPTRDNHVGYPSIQIHYPDSSYVVKAFSTMDLEYCDGYDYSYIRTDKKVFCNFDSLNGSSSIGNIFPPDVDRKNMRGIPLREEYYDAEGVLKKKIISTYCEDTVTIPRIYYSDAASYVRTSYSAVSPILSSKVVTAYEGDNALVSRESYTYNEFGQPETVEHSDSNGCIKEYYLYNNNQMYPSSTKSLAVRTAIVDTAEKIIARERYEYEPFNIKPTKVISDVISIPTTFNGYLSNAPSGSDTRECNFSYDSQFRLSRADFPGNAYIEYTWTPDGRYISTKSVNSEDNRLIFKWKDLVGLTRVLDPSGRNESYLYDSKNRLMQRRDTNGNPTEEYHYHLKNE